MLLHSLHLWERAKLWSSWLIFFKSRSLFQHKSFELKFKYKNCVLCVKMEQLFFISLPSYAVFEARWSAALRKRVEKALHREYKQCWAEWYWIFNEKSRQWGSSAQKGWSCYFSFREEKKTGKIGCSCESFTSPRKIIFQLCTVVMKNCYYSSTDRMTSDRQSDVGEFNWKRVVVNVDLMTSKSYFFLPLSTVRYTPTLEWIAAAAART